MKVQIRSSRIIKPLLYEDLDHTSPLTRNNISLSVFDKATYDSHMAIIYAYHPPTPPNRAIEVGLQKALVAYREWAGRLDKDDQDEPIILLNDEGVRFIEADFNGPFDQELLLKPSPTLLNLHPSLKHRVFFPRAIEENSEGKDDSFSEGVVELVQVQLTRFTCGSLVVGFTSHHLVADGHSTSKFLVAWGQACRGLEISPLPLHDRTIFTPRNPAVFEFEHTGVEFTSKNFFIKTHNYLKFDNIVVHKVHCTVEFLEKLKDKASSMNGNKNKPFSTFESLVAHLWRAITKSRCLNGDETSQIRISVDGRKRLNPKVSNEYFGNLVLWAFPSAKVKTLLQEPLFYATKLIHDAITKVNNKYFRSFIDFANFKVKEENLMTTADMTKTALCPNLEVDSWLGFPFYDLDFGGGCPFIFMPSYYPTEGMMFLLPSFVGDGSIEVFIPLFEENLTIFKENCNNIE